MSSTWEENRVKSKMWFEVRLQMAMNNEINLIGSWEALCNINLKAQSNMFHINDIQDMIRIMKREHFKT